MDSYNCKAEKVSSSTCCLIVLVYIMSSALMEVQHFLFSPFDQYTELS